MCPTLILEIPVQIWLKCSFSLKELLRCDMYLLASYTLMLCAGLCQEVLCTAYTIDFAWSSRSQLALVLLSLLCCTDQSLHPVFQSRTFQPLGGFLHVSHVLTLTCRLLSSCDGFSWIWGDMCKHVWMYLFYRQQLNRLLSKLLYNVIMNLPTIINESYEMHVS